MANKKLGSQRGVRIAALLLGVVMALVAGTVLHAAAAVWSSSASPWPLRLLSGLLALGMALMLMTFSSGVWRAWIYRGNAVRFQPAEPRAGHPFDVRWTLPPSAAAALDEPSLLRLRVAQYRTADDVSGTSETRVQDFTQAVRLPRNPDGGLILQARFELPTDAPTHDSRRLGELVEWRLELMGPDDMILLAESIPVQAAMPASAPDRFAPEHRASTAHENIPMCSVDERMPALPTGVSTREDTDALVLAFSQTGWRLLSLATLTAALGVFAIEGSAPISGILCAVLLALSLHAISHRETLQVRDDALVVSYRSWLWQRRISLPAHALERHLYQQLDQGSFSRQTPDLWTLWSRGGVRGGHVRLTPRMRGQGAMQIAQMLCWAHSQRSGRFSAGAQRTEATSSSAPGWGWLLWLLIVGALQAFQA